jgi:hypothetical protein
VGERNTRDGSDLGQADRLRGVILEVGTGPLDRRGGARWSVGFRVARQELLQPTSDPTEELGTGDGTLTAMT